MKIPRFSTIQSQLIIYFAVTILVPAGITTVVGLKLIQDAILTRAETKVISDINSALEIYRNRVSQIENITRLTAVRSLIIDGLVRGDTAFLRPELGRVLLREKLDILTIVDARGIVVSRGRNPAVARDTLTGDMHVARVLRDRQTVSGTGIVPADFLRRESPALAEQAAMEVTPTPRAKAAGAGQETSGLMLKVAVPVFDARNVFRGVLLGGVLLNRTYDLVDKIQQVVHEGEVYKGRETGTATIFQNDLRISTNVRNADGARAIATIVSEEVADAVLRGGGRWIGDAFVVNAWYITAYVPLRDVEKRIVGMLYVGILRQPFDDVWWNTLLLFLGVALAGVLLVVAVAVHQARRISRPLKTLEGVARLIAEGNYNEEVVLRAPDEIEHLAVSINRMARTLEREKAELEEWTETLEKRVRERTDQIKAIHAQLFRSEKLASLGKLAAGVAHEINNPLTGILTNSSLLLEDLAPDDPRREDVAVIVQETIRCREIVKRLLDFARRTKPQKRLTDVNVLLDTIVLLVRNQTSFRNIEIKRDLATGLPGIPADPDQIQQVFVNIVLNAAEAMTRGGELSIVSRAADAGSAITVSFTDTGPGISEENRDRIFDPFFTTKEQGTGLGLSISYGIVEAHGGTISVESTTGKGTTFIVRLPVEGVEEGGT